MKDELRRFAKFGKKTEVSKTPVPELGVEVDTFTNEFWTAGQRQGHSLHEISYRACFKPQLPRFFIDRLTSPGDVVYDPFMGRGTTLLEAALAGRIPAGCDVNPLSRILLMPRLAPPASDMVERRLKSLNLDWDGPVPEDLLVFYHEKTLRGLCAMRELFQHSSDPADAWLRMTAINRLTGHSSGFFSVYTLPPNQAVSVESQRKINQKRGQVPPERDIKSILWKKTRTLLKDCSESGHNFLKADPVTLSILTGSSESVPEIADGSVALAVTSPPFLDVVDYAQDNWLRNWFAGIDPARVNITMEKGIDGWRNVMTSVFRELKRILKPGGTVAFEVGEVRHGTVRLEEHVVPCGIHAGLEAELILINSQKFTKTANCWGVNNHTKGTNTNRVVLFRKP